ncbi:MAG TPA: endonuclease domain-containing protein [Patescibacteria group bacterium]|nr:endonuclease domain-containing protein [Patescibacteria group bacterium]
MDSTKKANDTRYLYKNDHRLKEIRQFLRANPTLAEKILWKFLRGRQLGHKFRRQYSIGGVVADFCSEEIKLVIEIDGWTHESEKIQMKDEGKEHFFETQGYKVIRFTNEQVYGDIEPIVKEIIRVCAELKRELKQGS